MQQNIASLLDALAQMAQQETDGHYTILRFTTGYKASLGTPRVQNIDLDAYFAIMALPQFSTLDEAVQYVLAHPEDLRFGSPWLTARADQRRAAFDDRSH